MSNIKPYIALLKSRLSMTVAFSGTFGYLLAPIEHKPVGIFLISLAGFVLTGAANIVNQLKEIELDKLMKRTQNRPLPLLHLVSPLVCSHCLERHFGFMRLPLTIPRFSGVKITVVCYSGRVPGRAPCRQAGGLSATNCGY